MARLKDRQTNEQLAMIQSFEGNCEILRTIFQLRALSFHIPADERGLLSNNNLLLSGVLQNVPILP